MNFAAIIIVIFVMIIIGAVCLLFMLYVNRCEDKILYSKFDKYENNKIHYMWVYWENIDGLDMPDYIKLCMNTIIKHCRKDFNLVILNEKTVYDYIPEFADINTDKLLIAQKVDIIRILLLYKYGGLYIDADTIVMKSPKEIVQKLEDYDYVGFGCTGEKCNYGYGRPSNGIMASRERGILVGKIRENILNKLMDSKKWEYFELGKYIIWEELDKLRNGGYEYHHYTNDYDGTRDIDGNWVETSRLFSTERIKYANEDDIIFIVLYNSQMENIRRLNSDYLLNSELNISKFINKSINKNEITTSTIFG